MQTKRWIVIVCLLGLVVAAAAFFGSSTCRVSGRQAMVPVNQSELTEVQQAQYQRGLEAQKELFHTLLGRLTSAMKDGGAANAIGVCNTDAKLIAQQVGEKYGLEIGRTSDKLRSQGNGAPAWAAVALGSNPEQGLVLSNELGAMGMINPIRIANACLQCHGSGDEIGEETRLKLGELYPEDRATGYAEGDLRGWFFMYIEPAAATP